jgi:hypothetical protein
MSEQPEIGQILGFAAGTGNYGTSGQVDALILDLIHEIERVFANVNQREWNYSWSGEDPRIPGIVFRGFRYPKYDFQDEIPEDEKEEAERDRIEAALPCFEYGGVAIWWYKHPGRSMSSNCRMSAQEWFDWHESAIKCIRAADVRHA